MFTHFHKDAFCLKTTFHSRKYTSIQTLMKRLSFGTNRLVLFIISRFVLWPSVLIHKKTSTGIKRDRRGYASKRQVTESKETRRIQKVELQSDIFNTYFQKHPSNLVASKPQVTVKELPPDKLNNHFANVSDSVITNDKSKLSDLSFLKRFCESKILL